MGARLDPVNRRSEAVAASGMNGNEMHSQSRSTHLVVLLAVMLACAFCGEPAAASQGISDSNIFPLKTGSASAVGHEPPPDLKDYVGPCSPNPFNPRTTIHFGVATRGPVRLTVFDVRGRVVRVLFESPDLAAGVYEAAWNGQDQCGRAVASGVYLSQLRSGGKVFNAVMVLVR